MWTFMSPTRGTMNLDDVAADITAQVARYPQDVFKIMVGTDSQPKWGERAVVFVTAVIVHRVGHGGTYYVHRERQPYIPSLRQRMFMEASYSLQVGTALEEALLRAGLELSIEVHLDVGDHGETKQWIREIVAWITANGYEARVKPDSFGASKVADRYTKQ
ncbi:hypothetical protein GCM10010885_24440 [Alicyclobacillus cellulosilyticus]|uniref:DUF458 domain-containing protein n=1 Tax=Alicyclobacillus cellulosilyticus TaxID=1003997 RepID=A0A917KHR5_9BACL|nr:ribonuclease H-like YkuK family protein [Alicyclobacillus cellulosilyticus]GGJ14266.1 hypothetical protein GCM10010885_24440 [Alicyclobacillus cellulosilyticus]